MGGWGWESNEGLGLWVVGVAVREWKRVQLRWWMENGSSGRGRAYAVLLLRVCRSGRGELEVGGVWAGALEEWREEDGELCGA